MTVETQIKVAIEFDSTIDFMNFFNELEKVKDSSEAMLNFYNILLETKTEEVDHTL